MEVPLRVVKREAQELEVVGVLELAESRRMHSRQSSGCLSLRGVASERRPGLNLPLELTLGPPLLDGSKDIELARFRRLRLAEDDQMVGLRQLSHQR